MNGQEDIKLCQIDIKYINVYFWIGIRKKGYKEINILYVES